MNTNKNIFEKASKNMPYEVPEGFFDQLDERLQKATKGNRTKRTKTFPIWKVASVAAVIVVALLIGTITLTKNPFSHNTIGDTGIAKVDTPNKSINAQNITTASEKQDDTKPLQQLPTSETKEATPQRKTTNKAPEKNHTQRQHIVNTVAKATKQTNIESSDPLNLYTPDATDAQSEQMLMDLAEADIFINPYTD